MSLKVIRSYKQEIFSYKFEFHVNCRATPYEMKLVNIFLLRSRTYVYAIEQLDEIYLYTCHTIQKNILYEYEWAILISPYTKF